METGTGSAAKVPGIIVCGKTGTVENYYKGEKQKSHAFFAAFAPRENPRIAIAVICENAGMGANSSAPIASLMIEQYLKDSIPEPDRKAKIEVLSKLNLMPARIYEAIRTRDSLSHKKDSSRLLERGYIKSIKDTMDIDDEDDSDMLDKLKKPNQNINLTDSAPKTPGNRNFKDIIEATLPEKLRIKDTTNTSK